MNLPGNIRILLGLLTLSFPISPLAAQAENRISSVAFVGEDSVMLRWVPSSVPVWQSGIDHGYIIKRYTIARSGEFIPDGLNKAKLMTNSPIRPSTDDEFEILAASDNRALIVKEVIYDQDLRQPQGNFKAFMKTYEEMEVRFGLALFMCDMSAKIAEAAGLLFTDTDIVKDERYVYSISLAHTPEGTQVEPAVVVVDAGELTILPQVTGIQAIFLDRVVKFRWSVNFFKGVYSAYAIEKSLDGKNFVEISDLPLVNFSEQENPDFFIYTDSLENNNQQVFYKVRGISPFGLSGPSSKIITGKGKPEFSAYVSIDTATVLENSRVLLKWRISDSEKAPVTSVNVFRSDSYDGPYEQLNSKPLNRETKLFTDEKPFFSNYYQVMLTGKDGRKSYSFPYFVQIEDNLPPLPPKDLSGIVDSAGVVSMVWRSNSEPDLLGYKVFRSNSIDDEFIPLAREISIENFCRDSINLNTLTQKICYQVVAIDRNYNSSEYSQVLVLSRPDTIPPAPAIITGIDNSSEKVIYTFEESPSSDIASYDLIMLPGRDTLEALVMSWEKLPARYEEEVSVYGDIEYRLVTTDRSGNHSDYSRKISISDKKTSTVPLTASQTSDGLKIILNWEIPKDFLPVKTVIYRGYNNTPPAIYATVAGASTFEDEKTEINTSYSYRIILYSNSEAISSDWLLFTPKTKKR